MNPHTLQHSYVPLPLFSGGSGRTGTYIALANLLDRLKSEGVVDVFQTVRALRLQRPRMVQTLVSDSCGNVR